MIDIKIKIKRKAILGFLFLIIVFTSLVYREELYLHYFSSSTFSSEVISKSYIKSERIYRKAGLMTITLYRILEKKNMGIYSIGFLDENSQIRYLSILRQEDYMNINEGDNINIVKGIKNKYKILGVFSQETYFLTIHHLICLITLFFALIFFRKNN
jgi:hypothetical protein